VNILKLMTEEKKDQVNINRIIPFYGSKCSLRQFGLSIVFENLKKKGINLKTKIILIPLLEIFFLPETSTWNYLNKIYINLILMWVNSLWLTLILELQIQ